MQSREGSRVPIPVGPGSVVTRRRGFAIAAAVVMVVGLGWSLLVERPEPSVAPSPDAEARGTASELTLPGALNVPSAPLAKESAGLTRAEVEPEAIAPVDLRQPTRVVGRCLGEDHAPLPGCTLSLRLLRLVPESDPALHTTDAEGRFAVVVPSGVAMELFIRSPGRATRLAPIGRINPGIQIELGDFVMQAGRRVAGTIRDDQGMPLEGVLVRLLREPTARELKFPTRPLRVLETRSDATGGLDFADPAKPGKWRAIASLPCVTKPSLVTIAPEAGDFILNLVVELNEATSQIAGLVRDEANRAVARAEVQAWLPASADQKEKVVARATTATDGSFVLDVQDRSAKLAVKANEAGKGGQASANKKPSVVETPVRLRVLAAGCEFLPDERFHPWGTRGVDLRVHRSDAIAVRVTRRDGQPVETFALHVFRPRPSDVSELRSRSSGYHEDGLAYAHGVLAGPQAVLIDAGPYLVPDGVRTLHHHGSAARLDIVLDRAVQRRIRVVGRDGRPAIGATVELLVPISDAPIHKFTQGAKLMDLWTRRGDRAMRLVSSFVDGYGMADLVGHPDTRYALRIKSDRHALYFEAIVLGPLSPVTEICLADGARVEGVVQPASFVAQIRKVGGKPPMVGLVTTVGEQVVRYETAPDEQGRFIFECVPPGDWQLELSWVTPVGMAASRIEIDEKWTSRRIDIPNESGAQRARWVLDREREVASRKAAEKVGLVVSVWTADTARTHRHVLGAVAGLAESETRHVELRVDSFLHATLRGRLVGDDPAWVKHARLVAVESDHVILWLPLEFVAYWITAEPGNYRCEVAGDNRHWWRTGQVMNLPPGQACEANLVVDLIGLRLRVLNAKGAPAKEVALHLRSQAASEDAIALPPTDDKGEVLGRVSPVVYRVERAGVVVGEVDLRGATAATVVRELKLVD